MTKNKRSLWPVAIIGAFLIFISGTVGLIVLACAHKSELVSADYYEQELAFQKRIEQTGRAQAGVNQSEIKYDATRSVISITLPGTPPETFGTVQLYRPSAAGLDRTMSLKLNESGTHSIDARPLPAGLWRVRVSWSSGGRDFFVEQKVIVTNHHLIAKTGA